MRQRGGHLHAVQDFGDVVRHTLGVGLVGQPREGLVRLLHQLRWVLGAQPAQQPTRHGDVLEARGTAALHASGGGRLVGSLAAAGRGVAEGWERRAIRVGQTPGALLQ